MIKVNGESFEHRDGLTIADILKAKNYIFPLIIVKIDETYVPRDAFANTVVPDGADVAVIHLISGG